MAKPEPRERILVAWSGGKDSALALDELRRSGRYGIVALITTVTERFDRISMHGVRRVLLERQAQALGLPVVPILLSEGASNEEYDGKMASLLQHYADQGVSGVAFGDIFLEDVRAYREERLTAVDFTGIFPLWGRDSATLAKEMIAAGFRAVVTSVDPRTLDRSFAGRTIDEGFLADLPPNVDPCGENGEFHSFVYAGPIFSAPIPFSVGAVELRDGFYFCDLLPA